MVRIEPRSALLRFYRLDRVFAQLGDGSGISFALSAVTDLDETSELFYHSTGKVGEGVTLHMYILTSTHNQVYCESPAEKESGKLETLALAGLQTRCFW